MKNFRWVNRAILLASLLVFFLAGFSLYYVNIPEQKLANQGLIIPGNDETYAKAIVQSYRLLVERYVIPVSPRLLYQSAKKTMNLIEQNWLKNEKKITEEGAKIILQWEREARSASNSKKNNRAPKRVVLSEKQKAEQEQRFAAEYLEFDAESLLQDYEAALANSRLQGFYSREFAKRLYTEILSALCRPLHDPFSGFFQESDFYQLSDTTNGSFGGVGLYITKQPDFGMKNNDSLETDGYQYLQHHYVKISRPFPGGPSFRAGIMTDDFIYAIDGESTKGWTVKQVQSHVRGIPGSKVKITVLRAQLHPIDFEVVREKIEVMAVRSDMIPLQNDSRILYVELSQFNAMAGRQFEKQVQQYLWKKQDEEGKIVAMILDMRNNPGGLLNVAVEIADRFLPGGLVVTTDARTSDNILELRAKKRVTIPEELPVYVMVNNESASAAEIVAGSLQDNQRAKVLGQKSFGKGSVQIPVTLPEGILKLSIAHFYTPKGVNLANNGIKPDHEFTVPPLREEEQEGIVQLLGDSVISSFVSQNRNYTDEEFQVFFEKEIRNHYKISERTAKRILYGEEMRYMKDIPVYNLVHDNILRNAVDYISERLTTKSEARTSKIKIPAENMLLSAAK